MPTLNSEVKSFRLPKPLADQLEAAHLREHKGLLVRVLLEDFFAGKLFYSKNRFEQEKKKQKEKNNKPIRTMSA